jgi:hypothetical protein
MINTTMDQAKADMTAILEREPQLGDFDFGIFDSRNKTPEQREAELREGRDKIIEPRSLEQFEAARGWLRRFDKIKVLNKRGTSYGLKHVAAHDIGYVTNGVFIAAAIAEGFTVERVGPNAWLNISTKPWRP